jgi:hypothetical protein
MAKNLLPEQHQVEIRGFSATCEAPSGMLAFPENLFRTSMD